MNQSTLHKMLAETDGTVYGIVTRSRWNSRDRETNRRVRLFVVAEGQIIEITQSVGSCLGLNSSDTGLMLRGVGYCPVQHVVDLLSRTLFEDPSRLKTAKL